VEWLAGGLTNHQPLKTTIYKVASISFTYINPSVYFTHQPSYCTIILRDIYTHKLRPDAKVRSLAEVHSRLPSKKMRLA